MACKLNSLCALSFNTDADALTFFWFELLNCVSVFN